MGEGKPSTSEAGFPLSQTLTLSQHGLGRCPKNPLRSFLNAISAKSLSDGKNLFGWCSLLHWGSNKFLFVAHFRVREAKNFCLLLTFALGGQQIFIFCSLSRWGSSKFLFVACFRVGEATNFCLLLTFALGKHLPTAFFLSWRIFCQNARRFACPDVISAKMRDVLLALTYFLRKRGTFSLS